MWSFVLLACVTLLPRTGATEPTIMPANITVIPNHNLVNMTTPPTNNSSQTTSSSFNSTTVYQSSGATPSSSNVTTETYSRSTNRSPNATTADVGTPIISSFSSQTIPITPSSTNTTDLSTTPYNQTSVIPTGDGLNPATKVTNPPSLPTQRPIGGSCGLLGSRGLIWALLLSSLHVVWM